jgi:hypothetical protein
VKNVGRKTSRQEEHLEDLGADGRIMECIFQKYDENARNEFMWIRIGTSDGFL